MDEEIASLQEKVELGIKTGEFLESDFGRAVMDFWESCKKGLNDVASVKKLTAEGALAELMGRQFTLEYIEGFRIYLQGLVDEGKFALEEIKRLENKEETIVRR